MKLVIVANNSRPRVRQALEELTPWMKQRAEVVAIGLLARWFAWIWLLPISVPLLQLYFDNECRRARRWVGALLTQLAKENGLVPVKARVAANSE